MARQNLYCRALLHPWAVLKEKVPEQCIAEYAETFPVVGGDFSFYGIPEPAFWKKLFEAATSRAMAIDAAFQIPVFWTQTSLMRDGLSHSRPILIASG